MRTRRITIWSCLAVLLVGLFVPVAASGAEGTVRVGVLGQRAGFNLAMGRAFEEGIGLALETINEGQGGILGKRLEVIFEDSGGTPERAVAALTKLITVDGVVMTVGETRSQSAMAETAIAEQYHHPLLVAEALGDDITARNSRYTFRAGPCNSGIIQDTLLGFISTSGFRRIAMIAEDTEFGRNASTLIEPELKTLGVQTSVLMLARDAGDLAMVIQSLKGFSADMVLVLHFGLDLPTLAAQIQSAVSTQPAPLLFSGSSLAGQWVDLGSPGQTGVNLSLSVERLHPAVDFTDVSRKLREAYRNKFGKELTDYRVRSVYDVLLVAADALRRAGSGDSERLVAALEQTQLTVASGVVQFGAEPGSYRYHHWQPPLPVIQWQEQQPVVVYPQPVATGALRR